MNPHVRWRLDVARRFATRLQGLCGLEAVAVLGSVARGYGDQYSDLELMLMWERPPGPRLHETVMHTLQVEYRYPAIDPGHASALRIKGLPGDV